MDDFPRLIEHAFPLEQASLDSVHEKNVRHGHISTLHIWPARRPLAACRAALLATLLPDPGDPEERRVLCEKIGGVVKHVVDKEGREKRETEGGILHWKRETENAETLEWFRQEIRKAYGGRAPRVLDPFAGGGAIPLEAMRLGCQATAVDINPVAWFILKCTLEYPQKLAGQQRPLPAFILKNQGFMEKFFKESQGLKGAPLRKALEKLGHQADNDQLTLTGIDLGDATLEADLAWHVRAWGHWVLEQARRELAPYYPVYADFEPLKPDAKSYETRPMQEVPPKEDGNPDIDALNDEFSDDYLANPKNPRWVAKPTVAYLWARTVRCKSCRAEIPLLKTQWLCKKDRHRVLLNMTLQPDNNGVEFSIEKNVIKKGGSPSQQRSYDKKLGAGTMSRAGATCPCCKAIMTMEDISLEGQAGKLGRKLTAVVIEGIKDKEFLLPSSKEQKVSNLSEVELENVYSSISYGLPCESTPAGGGQGASRAFSVQKYGINHWQDIFTPRQLLAAGIVVKHIRSLGENLRATDYTDTWSEGIKALIAVAFDRFINYMSTICIWESKAAEIKQTFLRFALPITWDFAEANPLSSADRYFVGAISCVHRVLQTNLPTATAMEPPTILRKSAIQATDGEFDLIVTDPPYYDAIPYSDLMDFFYVWLRRILHGENPELDAVFAQPLSPKWDEGEKDGELIDDSSRHGGDPQKSKSSYEKGMAKAFISCHKSLAETGRLVIVFAHKQPNAWETLVSALIRAGFVVDGSWPIVTEMRGGVRNFGRASLASSVWLVCKKRSKDARAGWDNAVLEEMRENIATKLREFWDAGIRGPDFVWAATGPALEAYSRHPVVKKADGDGIMTVSEFLNHVRRIVVDYVVGQVLSGTDDEAAADRLDEPTAYYLLHRNDFGLDEAPVGTVILYAVSCGVSDRELNDTWDLLTAGRAKTNGDEEEETDPDVATETDGDSGARVRLKTWAQRKGKSMGYEAPGGRPVPLIDRTHRLMHLWKAGDLRKVDEYLDDSGLRRHELFKRVLQSLIELSQINTEERSVLESISNHIGARGVRADSAQSRLRLDDA